MMQFLRCIGSSQTPREKKTLVLAQKMRLFGTGDEICERHTESLLTNSAAPEQKNVN